MANGTYGTTRPSLITSNDVDIYYFYRPTRSSESPNFANFKKLDSSLLSTTSIEQSDNEVSDSILPGMYDFKLPLDIFSEKGFYTVYIKPKEIKCKILDVSTLASYPDIRGIVIDKSEITPNEQGVFTNGGLVGYRVEYFDESKRQEFYRIITSSNLCEPVSSTLDSSYQKSVRYRFNDSSSLIFCTLSPSSSTSFKTNALPFIGKVSQEIVLINTKFNPIMLEIEMVDHDADTISLMLEGNQLRDVDKGLISTFNEDNEIYNQTEYGEIKSSITGQTLHTYKRNRNNDIDFEQDYNTIVEDNLN